ncbi:triose-phosphate transporter family-domain-containing protein [Chytriomyces sp. MP71]|nr:triose-phosphate transporter family-domain-containing protein [Chytriomyces sp. MP71]
MKPGSIAFILLWYVSSSMLSMANKQMLGTEHQKFHYPLLLSGVHSVSNSLITWILLRLFYKSELAESRRESFAVYLRATGLTAACAVLDIGLSNASLQFISLSFYTIVKSVVPVWVLIFSVMLGLEKLQMNMFLVISLMCAGVACTVMGEIKFSWFGFTLIQTASMVSGLRWGLTQLLLQMDARKSKTVTLHKPFSGGEKEKLLDEDFKSKKQDNPIKTLYRLSPVMAVMFTVGTLLLEAGGEHGWRKSSFFADFASTMRTISLLNFGTLLALIMTLSQFYVVSSTGVLTLSVAGTFKVIFTVAASIFWFGDTVTLLGLVGLFLSSSGIGLYSWIKAQNTRTINKEE